MLHNIIRSAFIKCDYNNRRHEKLKNSDYELRYLVNRKYSFNMKHQLRNYK